MDPARLSLHAGAVEGTTSSPHQPRMARVASGRLRSRGARFARPPLVVEDDLPLHVQPGPDGWEVRVEGTDRCLARTRTKRAAMKEARRHAKQRDVHIVEHLKDGRVR